MILHQVTSATYNFMCILHSVWSWMYI